MRVLDEIGNVSEISNLAPAQTEALAWDLEMVDTVSVSQSSLAYDAAAWPAIAYGKEGLIKIATRNVSSWNMEEIAAGEAGFSLTLDPLSGATMVSWGATSNKGGKTLLNFASKSNGSWVVTTVEPNGVLTERTSLARCR